MPAKIASFSTRSFSNNLVSGEGKTKPQPNLFRSFTPYLTVGKIFGLLPLSLNTSDNVKLQYPTAVASAVLHLLAVVYGQICLRGLYIAIYTHFALSEPGDKIIELIQLVMFYFMGFFLIPQLVGWIINWPELRDLLQQVKMVLVQIGDNKSASGRQSPPSARVIISGRAVAGTGVLLLGVVPGFTIYWYSRAAVFEDQNTRFQSSWFFPWSLLISLCGDLVYCAINLGIERGFSEINGRVARFQAESMDAKYFSKVNTKDDHQ